MISIVDYGFGNLGSIKNMLDYLGHENEIVEEPEQILHSSKIILPGVGSFDQGMKALNEKGWVSVLNQKVLEERIPVLGICLGMQLMTQESEEGTEKGLGWISAQTKKFVFPADTGLKIPHMGWNKVNVMGESPLHRQLTELEEIRYYFVHSYFVQPLETDNVIFSCNYGGGFCAAFQYDNIFGTQFHPEKSHQFGLKLLHNFSLL